MDYSGYKEKLDKLISDKNFSRLVIIMLLITVWVESAIMVYAIQHQKVVVTPPYIDKRFWVESNKASHEYIEIMGNYAAQLLYSFTPDTVNERYIEFMRFISPEYYKEVSTKLLADASLFKESAVSQNFIVQRTTIKDNKLMLTGILKRFVQDKVQDSKDITIEIVYKIKEGRFNVEKIGESKN